MAAGANHSVGLSTEGLVYVWGSNLRGQCGVQGRELLTEPTLLTSLSRVILIAAGQQHSIAVTSDHDVYMWGSSEFGQVARLVIVMGMAASLVIVIAWQPV